MKTPFLLLIFLCTLISVQAQTMYHNPVIAGNFPDPTIIRVGDNYYAAGTSSEWGPPYRLYESKDLINWQYLGGLFKEMPEWTMGSYWAPELYYRNGTYFLYYTARRKSDKKSFIGVASTKDIKQGFTDHGLIIEWTNEAIDAFVIELDGKLYITWKAYGLDKGKNIELLGAELSADGLKVTGKAFNLLTAETDNWEAGGMEGQCLVKRGEYIYMFYAGNSCCGRDCNYQTGVARAKSIQGPWEKHSGNPILYSGGDWRCPGHGTLVETPDHRFFYMYHAYNKNTNVYLGRQGMLDEIIWNPSTGWPEFRFGKTPSQQAETPEKGTVQKEIKAFEDKFATTQLAKEWAWDVSVNKPQTSISKGQLSLKGSNTPIGSFLGLQVRKGDYTLTATIENSKSESTASGICVYGTSSDAIGLSVKNGIAELWQVKNSERTVLITQKVNTFPVTLCLKTHQGENCQFGLMSGTQFQPIGETIHVTDLPQWDRPSMIGIQVQGEGAGIFRNVKLF